MPKKTFWVIPDFTYLVPIAASALPRRQQTLPWAVSGSLSCSAQCNAAPLAAHLTRTAGRKWAAEAAYHCMRPQETTESRT